MVLKLVLMTDEVDKFIREIHIDSEATFLELHDAILKSVGYSNDQMTSFFICNDYWEKETEITLMEMETSSDVDNYIMDETHLDEFLNDEGQKLLFVFDMFNERAFYMELKEIKTRETLPSPICKVSKGNPPAQLLDGMFMDDAALAKLSSVDFTDESEYGEEDFNEEDLDNLSINDNYFDE